MLPGACDRSWKCKSKTGAPHSFAREPADQYPGGRYAGSTAAALTVWRKSRRFMPPYYLSSSSPRRASRAAGVAGSARVAGAAPPYAEPALCTSTRRPPAWPTRIAAAATTMVPATVASVSAWAMAGRRETSTSAARTSVNPVAQTNCSAYRLVLFECGLRHDPLDPVLFSFAGVHRDDAGGEQHRLQGHESPARRGCELFPSRRPMHSRWRAPAGRRPVRGAHGRWRGAMVEMSRRFSSGMSRPSTRIPDLTSRRASRHRTPVGWNTSRLE